LDQPVGHSIQVRLFVIRPMWRIGPGWAAVGGVLASGALLSAPGHLLTLLLVWFIADPVLGTVWDMGAGGSSASAHRGVWRRLLTDQRPGHGPALVVFPYTQPDSRGQRFAERLGRFRCWWQESFWPEAGHEFITVALGMGLALLLSAVVGPAVLVLVIFSVALSWVAAFSQDEAPAHSPSSPAGAGNATWRGLAEFGVAWLIGSVALGQASPVVIALGVCYTATYLGLMRQPDRFWLAGAGQFAVTCLLVGLRHPLAASVTAITLVPQWGLRARAGSPGARGPYLRALQPFILVSMMAATLVIAR
jgi:hypothetical protein